MRLASAILAAAFFFAASPAYAQTAKLLETFKDWQVFIHEANNEKVCFAASAPTQKLPEGVNRGSVFLYLTTWHKDNVRNEVSVKIGYTFKPESVPVVTVGSETFELYSKDDKAFMRDPAEEEKLIAAMKQGASLTMTGLSSRGTETKDRYSLLGLTAALGHVEKACQ